MAVAESDTLKYSLIDTLANPTLLELFEDHLIEEWSPENIEFYKDVILFELDVDAAVRSFNAMRRPQTRRSSRYQMDPIAHSKKIVDRILEKAWIIYNAYIPQGAERQAMYARVLSGSVYFR